MHVGVDGVVHTQARTHASDRNRAVCWRKLGARGAAIAAVSTVSDFLRDPRIGAFAAYITPRVPQ